MSRETGKGGKFIWTPDSSLAPVKIKSQHEPDAESIIESCEKSNLKEKLSQEKKLASKLTTLLFPNMTFVEIVNSNLTTCCAKCENQVDWKPGMADKNHLFDTRFGNKHRNMLIACASFVSENSPSEKAVPQAVIDHTVYGIMTLALSIKNIIVSSKSKSGEEYICNILKTIDKSAVPLVIKILGIEHFSVFQNQFSEDCKIVFYVKTDWLAIYNKRSQLIASLHDYDFPPLGSK